MLTSKLRSLLKEQTGEAHLQELEKQKLNNQGQLDLEFIKGQQSLESQNYSITQIY